MLSLIASPLIRYILGGVVAFALLAAAYLYVDHRGYARAEAFYRAEIAIIKADYASKAAAERERQDAANNAAKQREAARVAELERARGELEQLQKEQAIAAEQDPDRDRIGLGAPSVQRLNKIR